MANHLDLEEQEQLDQLKHFWKQYGNAITWILILVLSFFAAWNFFHQWQRNQATQAAAMYEEVERIVSLGEDSKIERVFGDIKQNFSSTTYAQQAGLLVAQYFYSKGQLDIVKVTLAWVAENSPDLGYQAIAKLRLAAVLADSKNFDSALTYLNETYPHGFSPLVSDRKADIYLLQGKKSDAITEYLNAFKSFDEHSEYKRLVQVKLNSLGVDPLLATSSTATVANQQTEGGK